MIRFLPLVLLTICSGCQTAQEPSVEEFDLSAFFEAINGPGSFVLMHHETGNTKIYNPARAETRFIPASTFKIPNTLIALETGIVDGPDFTLPWDSIANPRGQYWPESWARDQTLRSAFQNSVVWYYQEAEDMGRLGDIRSPSAQFRTLTAHQNGPRWICPC